MAEPHPIIQRIRGIDLEYRHLAKEEISQLIQPGNGKGDWFAQWLARTPVEQRQLSLRSFLTDALDPKNSSYQSFAVADGTPIVYDRANVNNPLNAVRRHLRFVTIVVIDKAEISDQLTQYAIMERTLCLVSSSNPDGVDGSAFLQCASWDPHALGSNRGLMRFYERDRSPGERNRGWVFVGDSLHAFNSRTSNRGPFDGHIGGVMIMKELRRPWTHWFDGNNVNEFQQSLGSTPKAGSLADPHNALYDPLFAGKSQTPFFLLGRAETLEQVVKTSISKWYLSRFRHDFWEPGTTQPRQEINTPIKRWVAHILVNRTMNIATSATSTAQVNMNQDLETVPITLFYNANAFQWVLPSAGSETQATPTSHAHYMDAIRKLGLSLYYEAPANAESTGDTPSGGSRRLKVAVQHTEGPFPFPVIEPGIEDYEGIHTLIRQNPKLLPPKGIAAMLMVDFWNPMYSARREALMKYVPETATYDASAKSYNILQQFIVNVQSSPDSGTDGSVEHEILKLLATPDDKWEEEFTRRINSYLTCVQNRLSDKDSAAEAVEDYMTLAEGRRRTYRRLENILAEDGSGLDEFLLTLPIAALPEPFPIVEMTEKAEIKVTEAISKYGAVAGQCPAMRSRSMRNSPPPRQ